MSEVFAGYFARYPVEVQEKMQELYAIIVAVLPEGTTELLSYGIPAFRTTKTIIYFGAAKKHVGLYPASGHVFEVFREELANFKTTKGSIHFPYTAPIPKELVEKIVRFRLQEVSEG